MKAKFWLKSTSKGDMKESVRVDFENVPCPQVEVQSLQLVQLLQALTSEVFTIQTVHTALSRVSYKDY